MRRRRKTHNSKAYLIPVICTSLRLILYVQFYNMDIPILQIILEQKQFTSVPKESESADAMFYVVFNIFSTSHYLSVIYPY